MNPTSIEFEYAYVNPSSVTLEDQPRVALSTDREFSFLGSVNKPELFARMLLALVGVVRSNFTRHGVAQLDPVVTCDNSGIRFEGFSGCCGVYVIATFSNSMFSSFEPCLGTTNVDINDELRNGLARIRANNTLQLEVNDRGIDVDVNEKRFTEKKVKLPVRWLRGFGEVQSILPRLEHRLTASGQDTLKFLQRLPKNAANNKPLTATQSGRHIRVSTNLKDEAVPIIGTDRLRLLQPLLRSHDCVVSASRIEGGWTSSWHCEFDDAQFLLLLSPGIYRGFSGEGQLLEQLEDESWQNAIDQVRAELESQQQVAPEALGTRLNLAPQEVNKALAALATRGLLGFDMKRQCYIYRKLPFDSKLVETLQPRLVAARKLVANKLVQPHKPVGNDSDQTQWLVKGSGVDHLVTLTKDQSKCTCIWYNKYQNSRGPCKHILAASIESGNEE